MNSFLKYMLFAAVLVSAVGLCDCTADQPLDIPAAAYPAVSYNPDGTMNITLNAQIPGMTAASRAMGETPDYSSLKLYLLVFEKDEGLKQLERPGSQQTIDDDIHSGATLLQFRAELEPTEKETTIHLIATNAPDFEQQIGFGSEELVISRLYTKDGYEAYWQRIQLGTNIPSKEQAMVNDDGTRNEKYSDAEADKARAIVKKLSHVPMVRNFCRVSVQNSATNFTLTGLYVLNTVDRGSVAPYVAANRAGERFVDYYYEDDADGNKAYKGRDYAYISSQGHIGTLPAGVTLTNRPEDFEPGDNIDPVYFYERPARANSTERTYVIIRGNVDIEESNNTAAKSYTNRFYKIDLGYIDPAITGADNKAVGVFAYYNLLRNFDYLVRINSVEDAGYESLADAAKGAVFNNFSASVEARNMTSISDGTDMIFVNFTSYVFTQPNEWVDLEGQYRTRIAENNGGYVHNELITYSMDTSGDNVISSIDVIEEDNDPDEDAKNDWNIYRVRGTDPTDMLRQQTVYIYRGRKEDGTYGLYRVITFFSHTPWSLNHINTYAGLWESATDIPSWDWPNDDYFCEIGQSKGSPLTLFFELPAGLPQALFPMEFVIESDRQNIQNAYVGNAVVRSVQASESLFNNEQPLPYTKATGEEILPTKPTTTRIQYVKTVTWEDYFGGLSDELVGTGSAIVRCRFLTITDLAQDGIGGIGDDSNSMTTLRVSNKYFDKADPKNQYAQDSFKRDAATSDPTPGLWNFSGFVWSTIVEELKSGNTATAYSNDGLDISAPAGTLRSGTYEQVETPEDDGAEPVTTSYSYLLTTSADVAFSHTRSYPGNDKRRIRIYVMSTSDSDGGDGNPVELVVPEVTLTLSGKTASEKLTRTVDTTTAPFASQVFESNEIDMSGVQSVTVKVTAPDASPTRFYKIEFYPRWDELGSN